MIEGRFKPRPRIFFLVLLILVAVFAGTESAWAADLSGFSSDPIDSGYSSDSVDDSQLTEDTVSVDNQISSDSSDTDSYDDYWSSSTEAVAAESTEMTTSLAPNSSADASVSGENIASKTLLSGNCDEGIYVIENAAHTEKVVDITGASAESGAAVQLYSDNQTCAQRFKFTVGADGLYTITNVGSGLVLDVTAAHAENGTRVQQYQPNGTDAQKWELVEDEYGGIEILSALRGGHGLRFALDIPSASFFDGNTLQIWQRNDTIAQKWILNATQTVSDGVYEISSAIDGDHAIDVCGASDRQGANIQSYRRNASMAQRFGISYDSSTGYYVVTNASNGMVLDVDGASTSSGANVQQWVPNGTYAQKWAFLQKTDGTYEIVSAVSGLALDIASASRDDGANIQQWQRNNTVAQRWLLASVDTIADGRYVIAPTTDHSLALDVTGGSTDEGARLQLYSRNSTAAQSFEISKVYGTDYYVVRSMVSGKYLTISSSGLQACVAAPQGPANYQLWKATLSVGGVTFVSVTGMALDVLGNGMWSGNAVQGYAPNGTAAQKFCLLQGAYGISLGITDFKATLETGGKSNVVQSSYIDGIAYLFLPAFAPSQLNIACYRADGGNTVFISTQSDNAFSRESTSFVIRIGEQFDTANVKQYTYYIRQSLTAASTRLVIMKSANIDALFLVSADPYGRGRAYVEASSDHSAKSEGESYTLVAADGTSVGGVLSEIKGRGNSTWALSKKPYQIKLGEKIDLINGKKSNASKKWVLLANYTDATLMRNYIALNLAQELGLATTPECKFVDLYYDGEYRGTYLLAEKVEVGRGRVDISEIENESKDDTPIEDQPTAQATNTYGNTFQYVTGIASNADVTGGYLLEVDACYAAERSWFEIVAGGNTYHVVMKSPEDASYSQVRYISEYIQGSINALDVQSLASFDVNSLSRTYLIEEFAKNVDYIRWSSTYLYKDADESMIYSGPVWDFDLALGNSNQNDGDKPTGLISQAYSFFDINRSFRLMVRDLFNNELKPLVEDVLLGTQTTSNLMSVDSLAANVAASQSMNAYIWSSFYSDDNYLFVRPSSTFRANVANLKSWIAERTEWLDAYLNSSSWV